ncbi:hypothetical protein BCR44DRAFT_1412857 [Catenaria anguillulae PL171]|uniref:Uncharacterized protein n=1 Tax=Catenaria anguillulae PL171 TaxID=765915 RepID=A0A1Y2HY23_9FUNG|nr:hypothetical protein BCR44DRAFT_1412857 [Catenaria anguillulae PL171]
MKVGETAKFLIAPEYSTGFIQLESTLRRHRATLHAQRQGLPPPPTCCMGLASDSDAHADLYASADVPLELQVTLYDVQMPDEYVPEAWEMSAIDKANKVPELKAHATSEFQQGHVKQAREAYARALEYLESVQLELARQKREEHAYVPGTQVPPGVKRIEAVSPEWVDKTVLALRLNIALCSLKMNEYDKCVAQCSAVLEANPECVKARFRRALAHLRRGRDLELAQRDLLACIAPGVKGGLAKEDAAWASAWKELEAKRKLANEKEKGMWRGMFAT